MFADIVVKKGLNLSLVGQSAHKILTPKLSKSFSIYPSDFHGVFATLIVKENEIVKAGDILCYDKNSEKIKSDSLIKLASPEELIELAKLNPPPNKIKIFHGISLNHLLFSTKLYLS